MVVVAVGPDRQHHFAAANHAFQKMVGYTSEELQSLGPRDITHEEDRARIAYAHLVDGRLKYSFEPSLMPRAQTESNARDVHSKGTSGLQHQSDSVTTS